MNDKIIPSAEKRATHSAIILAYLLRGGTLTSLTAVTELGLVDLHSRLKEIRDSGIPVSEEIVVSGDGAYKRYFIRPEDTVTAIKKLQACGGKITGKTYGRKKKYRKKAD